MLMSTCRVFLLKILHLGYTYVWYVVILTCLFAFTIMVLFTNLITIRNTFFSVQNLLCNNSWSFFQWSEKTHHLIFTLFHFMDTLFGPYLAEKIWQRDKVMAIAIHFCTINLTPKGNLSSSLRSFYTHKWGSFVSIAKYMNKVRKFQKAWSMVGFWKINAKRYWKEKWGRQNNIFYEQKFLKFPITSLVLTNPFAIL